MKLRNIFAALAIAALAFVGCQEKERFLDEVKVSQSYLAFDKAGQSIDVTVNAIDKWEFTEVPEWITVNPASGNAGETKVTFTAGVAESTREALFYLNCGEATQVFSALQMTEKVELPVSTCAEVNGGEDGKVYRVSGTVTSIANTEYGNLYINDGTGEVYIYGTLYDGGSLKREIGPEIETFEMLEIEQRYQKLTDAEIQEFTKDPDLSKKLPQKEVSCITPFAYSPSTRG